MKKRLDAAAAAHLHASRLLVVRAIITHARFTGRKVFYAHLAWVLGLAPNGSQLKGLLQEITVEDATAGEPLSTSLVVTQETDKPGPGFFEQVKRLGLLPSGATQPQEDAFWQSQCTLLFV